MSDFIIVYRNPYNLKIGVVTSGTADDGDPVVFTTHEEADTIAKDVPILRLASYEIVELNL